MTTKKLKKSDISARARTFPMPSLRPKLYWVPQSSNCLFGFSLSGDHYFPNQPSKVLDSSSLFTKNKWGIIHLILGSAATCPQGARWDSGGAEMQFFLPLPKTISAAKALGTFSSSNLQCSALRKRNPCMWKTCIEIMARKVWWPL